MLATNLKILGVVLATVAFYTLLANMIPQLESEVPEEVAFGGEVTPEELVAAGEQLFTGAGGCTACHGLGARAPNLLTDEKGTGTIGARCGERVPGLTCKEYLHESLVAPGKFVVAGFPAMPDVTRGLTPTQIWTLVAFLEIQGGQVDVTAEDIARAEQASGGGAPAPAPGATAAAPAPAGPPAGASLEPLAILRGSGCFGCHQLGDEGAPVGPPFTGMGTRLTPDRIRRAILEPNADTARGYEAMAGVMPPNFGQQLSAAQLEALVRFLSGLK